MAMLLPKFIRPFGLALLCFASIAFATDETSQTALEKRAIESRQFDGITSKQLMSASINVLQDMGFNIDEVDAGLGTVTASKFWAPDDPLGLRESKGSFSLSNIGPFALLGAIYSAHKAYVENFKQDFKASLVVKPAITEPKDGSSSGHKINKKDKNLNALEKNTDSNKFIVRIIFETTSKIDDSKKPNENSTVAYSEIVKDPTLYQNFYDKLSKSVFFEEQKL